MVIRPYLLAIAAVLPLVAPEVWSGFRLGVWDIVLAVLAPTEQPLSVRSPAGPWAIALAFIWFSLAYWRRQIALWEAALVLVGAAAVLLRLGNAWLYAAAMIVPLGRQLSPLAIRPALLVAGVTACLAVAGQTLIWTRPPLLDSAAVQAAQASPGHGKVVADWRWAGELQHRLGSDRQVFAAGGLASETADFWADYLRIAQGHERWAELLQHMDVDLVVLDSADQQHAAAQLVRAAPDWRVTHDTAGALVAERIAR